MTQSPRLVVLAGPLVGTIIDLTVGEMLVGRRSTCGIVLADPRVSREHCVIRRQIDGFVIADLGSRQGTRVNGALVKSRLLVNGDRIRIGESELAFLSTPVAAAGGAPVDFVDDEPASGDTQEVSLDDSLLSHPERLLEDAPSDYASQSLEALLNVSTAVREAADLDGMARRILELVLDLVPAQRAGILLVSAGDPTPLASVEFVHAIARDGLRLRISRTIASRVLAGRIAFLSNAMLADSGVDPAASLREDAVTAVLCVPLSLFDRTIGVLYLDSCHPAARFNQRDLELATAIASLVAMPLVLAPRSGDAPAAASVAMEPLRPAHVAREVRRVVVLLVPDGPLDLGGALRLRATLDRVSGPSFEASILLLDYGTHVTASSNSGLSDHCLERLAVLLPHELERLALASLAPSVASLAALVASMHEAPQREGHADARGWFREVLVGTSLVASRASLAILEPCASGLPFACGDARSPSMSASFEWARDLALHAGRALSAELPEVQPLASGLPQILPLDGSTSISPQGRGVILVADPQDVVARKIRAAKTDTRPLDPDEDLSREICNLVLMLGIVSGEDISSLLARLPGRGYAALKGELEAAVEAWLAPVRERLHALREDSGIPARLRAGSAWLDASAREIAAAVSRKPQSMVGTGHPHVEVVAQGGSSR